ncbi:MAG: FixH family protein [Saprospiraceae bacterium]
MKLNWGASIAIFYACFMAILLYFVIKTTTYDHSLVLDNYYELDLNYQSRFDKISNQQSLAKAVEANYHTEKEIVELVFPSTMNKSTGTVLFFNPRTKYEDHTQPLRLDSTGRMQIPTQDFTAGRWKINIDWEHAKKAYYQEIEIIL